MTAETRMINRYTEMKKEIKIISKWFHKNHGGPEVNADEVEDATLRSMTHAMAGRRSAIGQEMLEIEKFANKNKIELPE